MLSVVSELLKEKILNISDIPFMQKNICNVMFLRLRLQDHINQTTMDGRSDCSVQYSLWLGPCLRGVASGTWGPPTASHDGGMMVKSDALSEGTSGSVL